ncbi:short-chain dehydrogenase [Xylona heveae TC161]|uniref:Short-chain dehydrogenase n=1 Tax=Xylona heveae (strain CBS 132557 / TC161) TaxID=1328760 RepID=A0A164ZVQ1_XYLHT|nr:short-chain dehydrogenase [Xylona heveae TC161]KZF19590.1 short-chain dehydrogenase [Xylona heveae TC161]
MQEFKETTTVDEVADAFAEHIKGKTVLITGINKTGLGGEAARAIARKQPSLIILAGRTTSKLREVEEEIRALAPSVKTRLLELDLNSQKHVRQAAAEVNKYPEPIEVLINNAGVMFPPYQLSDDGIESTFAIDHIGHFLFTNLIMPRIVAAGPGARIINISSRGHQFSDVFFDDWNFNDGKSYDKMKAYGQAKTANILFSRSLAQKLKRKGILSFSVHPGKILHTELGRFMSKEMLVAWGIIDKDGNLLETPGMMNKTLAQGAATHLVAGFDPSIVDRSGEYLQDCHIETDDISPYAKSEEGAERLWKLSEKLVGQKFEY